MDKIRVLLVDDHAILRQGLRALLDLYPDMEVVGEAGDGAQAIDMVRHTNADVVLMDIAMPGMGGLEATRRIVKENARARVLVLSQHDDERYVLPVCQAGASGYILKRSAAEDLVSSIRTVYRNGSILPPAIAEKLLRAYRNSTYIETAGAGGPLTEREREVLTLVAEGRTSREIGQLLHISQKTVMCHRANIYRKLGTHNQTELIRHAMQEGLISLQGLTL